MKKPSPKQPKNEAIVTNNCTKRSEGNIPVSLVFAPVRDANVVNSPGRGQYGNPLAGEGRGGGSSNSGQRGTP